MLIKNKAAVKMKMKRKEEEMKRNKNMMTSTLNSEKISNLVSMKMLKTDKN
jgi:hypothetical protein